MIQGYIRVSAPRLRPPHGVPVDILAFSNKILFTGKPTNISIVNIDIA